jgi:chromosome segregation ATPase
VAEPARDEPDLVEEVREKAGELARLLDTFSQRLRRMREQNKQVQDEISSFEDELERLRAWLRDEL